MAINYSYFKVTRKLRDKQSSTLGALNALNHILSLPNGLSDRFSAKALFIKSAILTFILP